MPIKKVFLPFLIILGILGLAGVFVVENILPYAGIKPMRHKPEELSWVMPKGFKPENYGLQGKNMAIRINDTMQLSALLVEAHTTSILGVVVVLHGISACKETQLERARLLADAGYASLLLDLRAHGQSEGEFCTFGYYEKQDLKVVADTLQALFPGRPMAIWGASLGGAVALQAMEYEPRYSFGIVESTFDEFNKVAMEYGADWFFGLRSAWLTNRVLHKSGLIAHFDPEAIKPVRSAAKIHRPILFFHGDKDSRIPMWFGRLNYEACPSTGKRWYQVPGAGHNNLWNMAGDSMRAEVLTFLNAQNKG